MKYLYAGLNFIYVLIVTIVIALILFALTGCTPY